MAELKTEPLKRLLDSGTTAYAVINDGVLDSSSISPDPRVSMLMTLFLMGHGFLPCGKDNCDCIERFFKEALPNCKLVMVSVTVIEEEGRG
jgi:hypothetical protein